MSETQNNTVRPNVVVIMSDQHNAGIMGCAGNAIVQTPNLDALARRGTRLTDMNCPHPLCVPSRMGFMTAQYPSDIDIFHNGSVLSSEIPTFAHALRAGGYETLLCGRMHFVGPDQLHGFEEHLLGDCQGPKILSPEIMGSGFNKTNGQTKYAVEVAGHGCTGYQAYDRIVTQTACDVLSNRQPGDRPLAMVVGLMLPHNPLICPKQWLDYYLERIPAPEPLPREYLDNLHPAVRKWRQRRGCDYLSAEQIHRGLAGYYGLVSELDANIGKIVRAVESSSFADNTIIIYTSDHGDSAGEHGLWWKTNFYNGAVRVPCIASWPGRLPRSRQLEAVISLIDLGPTVLELAGCTQLTDVAGRSFAKLLTGEEGPADWPDEVYSECYGAWGDQPAFMVRQGSWKIIYYHEFKSYQLFNLQDDPDELHDLAAESRTQDIARECLAKMKSRWSAEDILDRGTRQHRAYELLRKIGYQFVAPPQFAAGQADNCFDFEQLKYG